MTSPTPDGRHALKAEEHAADPDRNEDVPAFFRWFALTAGSILVGMQHATGAVGLVPPPATNMSVTKKRHGRHRATKNVERLTALVSAIAGLLAIARELVALLR